MMAAKLADVRRESEASHGTSRQQLERLKRDLSLVRDLIVFFDDTLRL